MSCDCLCGSRSSLPGNWPIRLGIVQAQDLSLGRLRVSFNEFDRMLSYWLPVVVPKTQSDKAYWLPDIGEQVVCLMDERDEDGVVLGAIYSRVDGTPVQNADICYLGFKDGASFEYDRAGHIFVLSFSDSASIRYDGAAHVLTLMFQDQAAIKYDALTHALSMNMNDGTVLKYDAAGHMFSIIGSNATAVVVSAPAGISLQSGSAYVNVSPNGVTINPPLQ